MGCPPNFEYSVARLRFRFVITATALRIFASDGIVQIIRLNNQDYKVLAVNNNNNNDNLYLNCKIPPVTQNCY